MGLRNSVLSGVLAVSLVAAGYGLARTTSDPGPANDADAPLAAAAALAASRPALFTPLDACRVMDTTKTTILGSTARALRVRGTTGFEAQGGTAGGCAVPASATSVVLSETVSNASAAGTLQLWRAGASQPTGVVANLVAGGKTTVSQTVALTPGGAADLKVRAVNMNAHVKVDVIGYYAPQLWAYVDNGGSLLRGSGATSSTKTSTGAYTVTFDRDVSTCSYVATPYAYNWVVAAGPGGGSNVNIFVHEQVSPYTSHDTSFFLQVTC